MSSLSLSRLCSRVEKPLAGAVLLSIALAAAFSQFAYSEVREPQPLPQGKSFDRHDFEEAKQLLNKQKWEEAALELRSLLKREPSHFLGVMELARALIYLKRREEALSLLVASAALQHGSRQKALISRVRVLSRLFLLQRTFQMYQDGLNALQAGKYRPARELFEKALQAEPDNIEILIRIGQCMIFEGDYDSAVERLRLAKRLNPYEPEIRLWLGQAMKERGELEEALTELKFAQEGLGNSARSPLWYAEALLVSGNPRDAVLVLERDEKAHPFHLINILALVRARMQLFRNGGDSLWSARKNLQAALSRLPQDGTGNELRFESELGIELRKPTAELKTEITSLLAQLDNSLKAQE